MLNVSKADLASVIHDMINKSNTPLATLPRNSKDGILLCDLDDLIEIMLAYPAYNVCGKKALELYSEYIKDLNNPQLLGEVITVLNTQIEFCNKRSLIDYSHVMNRTTRPQLLLLRSRRLRKLSNQLLNEDGSVSEINDSVSKYVNKGILSEYIFFRQVSNELLKIEELPEFYRDIILLYKSKTHDSIIFINDIITIYNSARVTGYYNNKVCLPYPYSQI